MAAKHLRFYFDYISSNAYLAWSQLPRLERDHGIEIEPVPVLFAALLEAHGQMGPAEVPPKTYWMWKNNLRKAAILGVPLHMPAFHPFNPLLALRASTLALDPEPRRRLIDALFRAVWSEGLHISEPDVVSAIADGVGLDGEDLVSRAASAAVKQRLRETSAAALKSGVFGVPTMTVGDELFWGFDDLAYLELLLAGKDPLDDDQVPDAESAPRASAMRRKMRDRREN